MKSNLNILTIFAVLVLSICTVKTNAQQIDVFVGDNISLQVTDIAVSMTGNLTNNGAIAGTSASSIYLDGAGAQTITGSAVNNTQIGQLDVSTTSGLTLGTNVSVSGTTGLLFTSGAVTLSNSDLTFTSGSTWSGNNTTNKFFVTNGTGLVYADNAGSNVTYPIGYTLSAANFQPVTLNNSGTSDKFGVRVQANCNTSYNSSNGNASGSDLTASAVALTWVVNEGVVGGSNLSITTQWDGGDELTSFTRSACALSMYDYSTSAWVGSAFAASSGSNPYTRTRTGITNNLAFRIFGLGDSHSVLPIKLISFSVDKNNMNADLLWATAQEKNNDHFDIERSIDGINFEKIGEVAGAGTINYTQNYTFTDVNVGASKAANFFYYRLKQVDIDGTNTNSNIQSVKFEKNTTANAIEVSTFPNPTMDVLNVAMNNITVDKIHFSLVSLNGSVVKEGVWNANGNVEAKFNVAVDDLNTGAYILKISQVDQSMLKSIPFIKM